MRVCGLVIVQHLAVHKLTGLKDTVTVFFVFFFLEFKETDVIPSAFSASVSSGLFVHECVRSPQERAVKGTGVWISTCGRGGREGDQTTVSTETLLSGEMQTWRARGRGGSCGGYRTDGQTAGSDLVDRNRSEYPSRRNQCG